MDNISSWLTYSDFLTEIARRTSQSNCSVQLKLISSQRFGAHVIGQTFHDVDIWQGPVVLEWEIDGMVARMNSNKAEQASLPYTKYSFLYRFNKL